MYLSDRHISKNEKKNSFSSLMSATKKDENNDHREIYLKNRGLKNTVSIFISQTMHSIKGYLFFKKERTESRGQELIIGNLIVMIRYGVAIIENIENKVVLDQKIPVFRIRFLHKNLTISLAQPNLISSNIRPVMHEAESDSLLCIIKDKPESLFSEDALRQVVKKCIKNDFSYQSLSETTTPIELSQILYHLYGTYGDIKQSFSRNKMFHDILEQLTQEISIVKTLSKESASNLILSLLEHH